MIKIYDKELSEETIASLCEKHLGMTFDRPEPEWKLVACNRPPEDMEPYTTYVWLKQGGSVIDIFAKNRRKSKILGHIEEDGFDRAACADIEGRKTGDDGMIVII